MAAAGKPLAVDLDEDRYHRQSLITWWDQERLSDASVLVIGAGALGNELVKNLALVGVGTVVVVDLDQVENSNLSRGVLFREGDEGADKATVVAARAAELNPDDPSDPGRGRRSPDHFAWPVRPLRRRARWARQPRGAPARQPGLLESRGRPGSTGRSRA